MDRVMRDSLAIAIAVPSIAAVLLVAVVGPDRSCVSAAILAFCFAPLGAFGAVMLIRPDAERWVNLPVHEDCVDRDAIAHMLGAALVIGTAIISSAVSIMSRGGSILSGFILIGISVAIILLPLAYVKRTPAELWSIPSTWSRPAKTAVVLTSAILAVAPIAACEILFEGSADVEIEFGDDSVTISAPMFDHALAYAGITEIRLDEDFDRGFRTIGYSGADVSSGTFKNRGLGTYELAAYNENPQCILVSFEGAVYAINQSTGTETMAVYQELLLRTGLNAPRSSSPDDRTDPPWLLKDDPI